MSEAALAAAVDAARAAGRVALKYYNAGFEIVLKPDATPVTQADREAERTIVEILGRAFPEHGFLGEEFGGSGNAATRWIIDPIDGTKNFVRGVPVWATLIALLDGPDPIIGVVSAPGLARRWWAERGGGAWASALGGAPRRLAVSRVASLADASLSYASIGAWTASRDRFLALTRRVWRTRAYGDFWSYMLVAEGAVDVAAEPELSLWDMAALAPIVVEAGGRFTGLDGVPGVQQGNAAASNGLLHDALLAALRLPSP